MILYEWVFQLLKGNVLSKNIIDFLIETARFISGYSQSVLGVPFLFVPQILKNKFFPCKDFLCIEKNSVRCQILSGSLLNFHKENLKLSKRYFCWRIICCKVWNLVNSTLFAESVRKFFQSDPPWITIRSTLSDKSLLADWRFHSFV